MASVKEAIIVAGRSYEIAADRRGKTAHLTNQIRQSVIRTRRGRTVVVLGLDLEDKDEADDERDVAGYQGPGPPS